MKKIFFLLITASFFFTACDKDFGDLNVDKKRPATIAPGPLFANATREVTDAVTSSNVNLNIFRMLSQYWTETTYTDEANYDLATRNIPQNFWNAIYVNGIKNLKECQGLIPSQDPVFFPAAVQANQKATTEIMMVYAYSTLVNVYGDIPYSEALDIDNVYPKYDDAATIYADLLVRLEAAVASIDESAGGFGANDLVYGGNMTGWKKFGSSLQLRLAMMLADVDDAAAASVIGKLDVADIITTNGDNTYFQYLAGPPNTNPIWVDLVQSGRKDFVAANTVVDYMNTLTDPRVPYFFTVDASDGYSGGTYAASNNYATYSKPADRILVSNFEAILFDAAEGNFLLAEAVERGYNVPGTAAEYYTNAIAASMDYWKVPGSATAAYLALPAVAYATAAGDWKAKIGFQKWIALYNRGIEGWTEWRRLDTPTLNVPDGLEYGDIPVRFTYPVQEQTLNADNYKNASDAIGGDDVTTKLFWDKY